MRSLQHVQQSEHAIHEPFPKFRRDNRVLEGDDYWLDAKKP